MFKTATSWRVEDLRVGQVIYCPPNEVVDPRTRKATGALQKFRVKSVTAGAAELEIYKGDDPAEMPPETP